MRSCQLDEAAGERAQRHVHEQCDEADADDADVDDVELEERAGVLDQRAETLLRRDQLGGHQRRPGDAERDAQGRQHVRHGERDDDLAEYLAVGRPQRARDAHVDRADLRDALVHDDHAGEERGVEEDHGLGELIDTEVDDHQRDEGDRRQRAEEIYQRIDEGADVAIPPEHEADRYGQRDAGENADEDAPRRHQDVEWQAALDELDEAASNIVRRRHQRRIDQAAVVNAVPAR